MTATDILRNEIISKILSISNKDYLFALKNLVDKSIFNDEVIKLSAEQKIMLEMSDIDIKSGNLISQMTLKKQQAEWLKEK